MKNGNENLFLYNNNFNICSICNSPKILINKALIRNIKLKKILSKIGEDELKN